MLAIDINVKGPPPSPISPHQLPPPIATIVWKNLGRRMMDVLLHRSQHTDFYVVHLLWRWNGGWWWRWYTNKHYFYIIRCVYNAGIFTRAHTHTQAPAHTGDRLCLCNIKCMYKPMLYDNKLWGQKSWMKDAHVVRRSSLRSWRPDQTNQIENYINGSGAHQRSYIYSILFHPCASWFSFRFYLAVVSWQTNR